MVRVVIIVGISVLVLACGHSSKIDDAHAFDFAYEGQLPDDFDHHYDYKKQLQALKDGFYYNKDGYKVSLNLKTTEYRHPKTNTPDMTGPSDSEKDITIKAKPSTPVVIEFE